MFAFDILVEFNHACKFLVIIATISVTYILFCFVLTLPCWYDNGFNRLLDKGKELVPMILCGNAYIYICGDGTQMAKDVMNTLVTMLQVHGDQSEECAHEFLQEMKSRRRLLMDVWS